METVLITGGTGIIGSELIPKLKEAGFAVRVLSRSAKPIEGVEVFTWNIEEDFIQESALTDVDHIIHLAGYTVSKRWTSERKKLMEDSRIKAIHLLTNHLQNQKLKTFVSAAGVSIYGTQTSEKIFTESDSPALETDDYLGHLSQDWERAALNFQNHANRTILLRTPVVLSRSGGALEKMAAPIKLGFGSPIGSGKQYMPWVHIDDIVAAYLYALQNEQMEGFYNVCAAEHVTNSTFTKQVASTLKKPLWLPRVPGFVLRLIYGKMANIILKGSRVSGEKIKSLGFTYKFQSLSLALKDLLEK